MTEIGRGGEFGELISRKRKGHGLINLFDDEIAPRVLVNVAEDLVNNLVHLGRCLGGDKLFESDDGVLLTLVDLVKQQLCNLFSM